MTQVTQFNVKFDTEEIPEGFDANETYQVLAIDRIEEENDLITEFLLADQDGRFQWVDSEDLVQVESQAFSPSNGINRYQQQVRRTY